MEDKPSFAFKHKRDSSLITIIDDLNNNSIGIELENPGHEFGYIPFSRKQMSALVLLCKEIKRKYIIKSDWVLGHSDISPDRKLDPGKKFEWNIIKRIFK